MRDEWRSVEDLTERRMRGENSEERQRNKGSTGWEERKIS